MAALCFVPYAWSVRATLPGLRAAFWVAAAELALWNFLSQGLLNIALLYTDAMRVSFIAQARIARVCAAACATATALRVRLCADAPRRARAQTAIVLTPLIAASQGQAVRRSTWAACAVALAGVALLASDGGGAAAGAAAAAAAPALRLSLGDALALGGAVTSSLYIYRISELGKRGLSNDLTQAVKVAIIAALYCVWALVDGARLVAAGGAFVALWPGWRSALAWGVLAYSAVVPGALADVLQARGQARVEAAEAQVLLGAEPLWTAVLGMALLHERLGAAGWAGAGLIVAAVLLASGAAEALVGRRGAAPPPAAAPL
jgi:drug/metabolite transporter (DMT)-like permease